MVPRNQLPFRRLIGAQGCTKRGPSCTEGSRPLPPFQRRCDRNNCDAQRCIMLMGHFPPRPYLPPYLCRLSICLGSFLQRNCCPQVRPAHPSHPIQGVWDPHNPPGPKARGTPLSHMALPLQCLKGPDKHLPGASRSEERECYLVARQWVPTPIQSPFVTMAHHNRGSSSDFHLPQDAEEWE